MSNVRWNAEKSKQLKAERGLSFEDVLYYIENEKQLAIVEHPNREKYPHQKMFILIIDNYAWLVPFIEEESSIFLKTIIPSRKATQKYLRKKYEN